jgi:hypothetical protein
MRPVRVGCSGWQYDSWRGRLYPEGIGKGRWLEHYAQVFDTVEVNSTFYRLASREAVARWVEQTPPGFVFTAKASRYMTHIRRLQNLAEGIGRYYERIEPARASLLRVPPRELVHGAGLQAAARSWCRTRRRRPPTLALPGARADRGLDPRAAAPRAPRPAWQVLGDGAGRVGPADHAVAPPGRGPRLFQQRLGGLCGGQRALAHAAAAALSRRVSARRRRRETCICE